MSETAKEAARRLATKKISEGFKLETLHEYRDAEGKIVYWRIRLKHPNGNKWIRPMNLNGQSFELGEPDFPNGKPLYRLPDLIARPDDEAWYVEGEWNVDHLARLGVLATTSGSAESAKHADFAPLANHRVNIWPDNDEPGLRHAREVAEKLIALGAAVQLVDIGKLNLPPKGDCVDWLKAHLDTTAADVKALPLVEYTRQPMKATSEPDSPRKSQSTSLIELAEHVSVFHDDDEAYVIIPANDHAETWALRSKRFRDYLHRQFYLHERRSPSAQAVEDALRSLSGKALFESPEGTVHRRVAEHQGNIYLDLCDSHWRVIEVTAHGWRVSTDSPVRFIRSSGMQGLPVPTTAGSPEALWGYLNISEIDRCLVLAWLVAAMRSKGPYPVLILQGEQGTAKSTAAKVIRFLIDPSAAPLRSIPRDERDLMITARNSWIIALDNLSGLSPWLSDALCRIATEGGFATRELYTDSDEVLINVQRPIILNGIDDVATRQDLIDRAIIINLEPIPEEERKPEAEFWHSFNEAKPAILGALLNRVSRASRELTNTQLKMRPRMADFALWATAAEAQHEKGTFIQAYQGNRQCAIESGLEGSPVASALRALTASRLSWEGTATELLGELFHLADERTRIQRSWPKSAKGLSSQLRRLATALRAVGIEIKHSRDGKAGTRNIHVKKACKNASEPSDSSATSINQRFKVDAALTQRHKTDASPVQADASEDELSPCSGISADATDDTDANSQALSNALRIWTKPTFEHIRIAEGVL